MSKPFTVSSWLSNWKAILLTCLLCVSIVRSAQAQKLFGSEVTGEAAGSCGGSGAYIVKETTTYFLGIAVSTSYQVYDANNVAVADECNLIDAYKNHVGGAQ